MAALPKDIKFSMREHFDNMAPMYDEFGQIFYFLAQKLFDLNPDPITSSSIIHDNGCGNGVVSSVLLKHLPNKTDQPTIHATDLSPEMIRETKKHAEGVKAEEMDSEALTFPDDMFSHSFTNMLHPTSLRPDLLTSEIYRTLKPGGVALASQFTSYGWIAIADAAIHKLRPDAPTFLGPVPEEWKKPEWFKGLFVEAGFRDVAVHETERRILFSDMTERARRHLLSSVVKMVASDWSDEESRELFEEMMRRMSPEGKAEGEGFDHGIVIVVARK